MSSVVPSPGREMLRHGLDAIRGRWVWYLGLGIALIVLGLIALGRPFIATEAVVITIGVLLLIGGVLQAVAAFYTRDWSGFFLGLLLGVLYFLAGVYTFRHPVMAAATLTLLVGIFLLLEGVFKIVAALTYRFPQWGWVLASGILSTLLGLYVWSEVLVLTPVLLGTLLGIDMIVNGGMWIAFAFALRKLAGRIERRLGE